MVNPNPKALWEIIELQTTDQIKLNEQLYRMNYTVKHFEIFQMIAQRPKSKTIEYRILKLFCQTSCEYVLAIRRL